MSQLFFFPLDIKFPLYLFVTILHNLLIIFQPDFPAKIKKKNEEIIL